MEPHEPDDLLDDLIRRYGEGAIVAVRPYMNDTGETLRWFVEIDGLDVPDLDVRDSRRGELMVMLLVRGGDEIEIGRWSPKTYPHGPAAFLRTLGDLARHR